MEIENILRTTIRLIMWIMVWIIQTSPNEALVLPCNERTQIRTFVGHFVKLKKLHNGFCDSRFTKILKKFLGGADLAKMMWVGGHLRNQTIILSWPYINAR